MKDLNNEIPNFAILNQICNKIYKDHKPSDSRIIRKHKLETLGSSPRRK